MTTVAIYQPQVFPRLHWWNRVLQSDHFVIYDDAQFKRQSWQHRFQILEGEEKKPLLTLPVKHVDLFKPINQVRLFDGTDRWRRKMLRTLWFNYCKFDGWIYWLLVKRCLEKEGLFEAQMYFINKAKTILDIETELHLSSNIPKSKGRTQKLVDICRYFGADEYLCGQPAVLNYMDLSLFKDANIRVRIQNWECKYLDNISLIDPLLRYGCEAREWIE